MFEVYWICNSEKKAFLKKVFQRIFSMNLKCPLNLFTAQDIFDKKKFLP